MDKQNICTTEVKIFATATMLQTQICVYTPACPGYKWLKLLSNGEVPIDNHANEGLYMMNVGHNFHNVKRM